MKFVTTTQQLLYTYYMNAHLKLHLIFGRSKIQFKEEMCFGIFVDEWKKKDMRTIQEGKNLLLFG